MNKISLFRFAFWRVMGISFTVAEAGYWLGLYGSKIGLASLCLIGLGLSIIFVADGVRALMEDRITQEEKKRLEADLRLAMGEDVGSTLQEIVNGSLLTADEALEVVKSLGIAANMGSIIHGPDKTVSFYVNIPD